MAEREREIKLAPCAPEVLEELARTPVLAGFRLSSTETREQLDVYLDTEDFRLFAAGYSLRHRRRSGTVKATLKEIPGTEARGLLRERREIEEVLGEESGPRGAVGEAVAALVGNAKLLPILCLRTRRRVRQVLAGGSPVAELCLDEVEVGRREGEGPSARFREVEVEDAGEGSGALEAIGEELLASARFEPSPLSKFERGLALLELHARARDAAGRRA